MKKRNLIKFFALTLCFITILSTIVLAKENETTQLSTTSEVKVDPHPPATEFPE